MAQAITIQNLKGFFDVREYSDKPREQRVIKSNGSAITFNVIFDEKPAQFATFAKSFTTKAGSTAYIVKFKIGSNANWFDNYGKPCPHPDNTYLDANRFVCNIQYVELNPNAPMKASGYWVNNIMFKEEQANPFEGMAFDAEPQAEISEQHVEVVVPAEPVVAAPVYEEQVYTAPVAEPQPMPSAIGDDVEIPF